MNIIVLETESKYESQVKSAIDSLTSHKLVKFVNSIKLLEKFLQEQSDPKTLEPEKILKLNETTILIADLSEIEIKKWKMTIQEWQKIFSQKLIVLITTYEKPELNRNFLNSLEVKNIVFKPYDFLIFSELIHLASQENKLSQPQFLKLQTSKSFIGLLKEVEVNSISEIGFTSISDVKIPELSLTFYYSQILGGFWAQCLQSLPQAGTSHFANRFQFISFEKTKLNQLRKYIQVKKPLNKNWIEKSQNINSKIKVVLIAHHEVEYEQLKNDLNKYFKNIEVLFHDIVLAQSTKKPILADVILDFSKIEPDLIKDLWSKGSLVIRFESKIPQEKTIRELIQIYQDVHIEPLDKSFLFKKINFLCPQLVAHDEIVVNAVPVEEKIKAVNKAKVISLNETLINFDYPRQLKLNDFREFVFFDEGDGDSIEIPGYCQFSEISKTATQEDPYKYFNQFTFFAINDHYFKEIRKWLLKNYIKNEGS